MQGMFDDTFHYTPTVGWMFLPIEEYEGGGEAAKFEPLKDNLQVRDEFALRLAFLFLASRYF